MMLIKEFHNHAKWKRINIAIAMDSLSDPPCVLEILDFLTLKMFCLKPPRSSILRLQLHVRLRHGVDREWDKVNHRCLDLLETRNGLQFYPMVSDVFWCRGTFIYILKQGSDDFYPTPSDGHVGPKKNSTVKQKKLYWFRGMYVILWPQSPPKPSIHLTPAIFSACVDTRMHGAVTELPL